MTFTRDEEKIAKVLSKIEWTAIFFFAGLFILVGALVETGVIKMLAAEAMKITEGSVNATAILIIWMSAIASAFVDNIPFVATMIPLIKDMGAMGITNLDPLWWSLALGACLGGNGTLIGASANVVVAEKEVGARKNNFQPMEICMSEQEACQEAGRCLRCDKFGFSALKGGRRLRW